MWYALAYDRYAVKTWPEGTSLIVPNLSLPGTQTIRTSPVNPTIPVQIPASETSRPEDQALLGTLPAGKELAYKAQKPGLQVEEVAHGPSAPETPSQVPSPAPPLGLTPVPTCLSLEDGIPGAGLLSGLSASGPVYSSDEGLARNTVGWSGEPSQSVPLGQTHRRQIQQGLEAMDQIAPGYRKRLDQLLSPDIDPKLKESQNQVVEQQNRLLSQNGKLLSMPDERLSPHQKKQKEELNQRLDGLSAQYDQLESQLSQKQFENLGQARLLAQSFLHRLRKGGQVADVSSKVTIDPKAAEQLKKDGISRQDVLHWINEFHHQTGLPAPDQLKLRYTEKRPNYEPVADAVNIGDKFSKRMALHEIAHRLEYKHPEISMANKSWVQARCKNGGYSDQPSKLQDLVPKGTYKSDEVALEDSFVDPYVGKQYPDLATEVLSVGLEHFADEHRFVKLYQQDPEHLFLTLGALQCAHGKNW